MSSKPVDMELRKAFADLQHKMLETTQKIKLADVQIDAFKRTMQHSQLTSREVNALPPGTKTYEAVGRMFLLASVAEVLQNLQKKSDLCKDRIHALEDSKTYLERNLKDSENNLREMVQQRKDMASQDTS